LSKPEAEWRTTGLEWCVVFVVVKNCQNNGRKFTGRSSEG